MNNRRDMTFDERDAVEPDPHRCHSRLVRDGHLDRQNTRIRSEVADVQQRRVLVGENVHAERCIGGWGAGHLAVLSVGRASVQGARSPIIECMFEGWEEEFTPSLRRELDRPRKVLVDLSVALPTHGDTFRRDQLPMRVKIGGLNLMTTVPGELLAWARSASGGWLALVSFVVTTANGHGQLPVTQWCPATAVTQQGPPTPS